MALGQVPHAARHALGLGLCGLAGLGVPGALPGETAWGGAEKKGGKAGKPGSLRNN